MAGGRKPRQADQIYSQLGAILPCPPSHGRLARPSVTHHTVVRTRGHDHIHKHTEMHTYIGTEEHVHATQVPPMHAHLRTQNATSHRHCVITDSAMARRCGWNTSNNRSAERPRTIAADHSLAIQDRSDQPTIYLYASHVR